MLVAGTRLGRYTILDLVAVGGMGEVYRAEDARLHRDVAIKVLPAHLERDKASLERFRREARAVAALSHPNILSIFDFGSEEGVHYAVTEMLEGETLRARLVRARFTPRDALELMSEVADGVAAAHARGIVHRDLKPENIFITRNGRVKVLDFGLARNASGVFASRAELAATEILPTEPGVVIGTVGYLAPEQLEARPPTPASDVFAMACILYEMLAGKVPFHRDTAAHAMVALLHDDAPRLPLTGQTIERDIDALLQRCLSKDPEDRPHDAGELLIALRAILGGERVSRILRPPAPKPVRFARLAAIGIVLAMIGTAFFFVQRARHRQLDHGYDLRASDVRGDSETKRLIELALRADAEGNRPKAMELFEEAWRHPGGTALPAAFLSSFQDAAGNARESRRWRDLANARLEGASTYESLLARYLASPSSQRAQELALAKSALEMRPDAWRLRLAAAHIHLGQRDREAARRELQQIDFRKPDDRRLMFVLADRASLGDIDGARRDLHRSALVDRPPMLFYTEARIAWSNAGPHGDVRQAQALFDRAAEAAAAEGLTPMETEAYVLSGIALLRMRDWSEAQRRFALAGSKARQTGLSARVFEAAALAGYAAHRTGDAAERDRMFNAAMSVAPPPAPRAALIVLAYRLLSPMASTWNVAPIEQEPLLAPAMSLIRAREAWAASDRDRANRELRRARAEGIDTTELREEAELLAAELGLPSQRLLPDPPYPNVLRYLAIFDHELISIGTGAVR